MFNSELYEISEKAFKSMNHEGLKKRNKQIEKEIIEIIKAHANNIDEYGIATISVWPDVNKHDFDVLRSIIMSGKLEYFENEYSLYYVGESFTGTNNILTFVWNSVEYNTKNMFDDRAEAIARKF